jgi:tetratricopeptide (TPR) repeat protein
MVYAALSLVFVYLAALTITRNTDWKDEPSIYENTLKYARFSEILTNLGVYYATHGQYDKSIKAHKEAISLAPGNPLYRNNIALAYYKIGRRDLAAEHCRASLKIDPDQPEIRELLAKCGN